MHFYATRPANAYQDVKPDLSLRDAILFALKQNPTLKSALAERQAERTKAERDKPIPKPFVTASVAGTLQGPRVTFPRPNAPDATVLPITYGYIEIAVEQTLYRGGGNAARLRYRNLLETADVRAKMEMNLTAKTTALAFVAVLQAESGVRLAQEGVALAEKRLQLTEQLIKNGLVKPIDKETVAALVAEANSGLATAESGAILAKLNLNRLMGLPQDSEIRVTHTYPTRTYDLASLIAKAHKQRAEMELVALGKKSAILGVELANSQKEPSAFLRAQIREQTTTAFDRNLYFGATLEVRFPILDGGKVRQDVEEARAALQKLNALEAETRSGVEMEVRTAFQKMNEAQRLTDYAKQRVTNLEKSIVVAERAYELGRTTILELQAAYRELNSAKEAVLQSRYKYLGAEVEFLAATGELLLPEDYIRTLQSAQTRKIQP